MVNLFLRGQGDNGSLTAALLALLEHSDRELFNGFLERAQLPYHAPPGADLDFRLPEPGAGAGGAIAGPDFRLNLIAQAPGAQIPASVPGAGGETLVITLAGRPPEGARAMSWEQVDRWLAGAAERYDPESRTGFLVRQFRDFLRASGVEYFAGFSAEMLASAPDAQAELQRFYHEAGQFFDRLGPTLAGLGAPAAGGETALAGLLGVAPAPGLAEVRRSRAEDQLAGYLYRDYTGALLGATGFLRVAIHLPQREMQLAIWLAPGPAGGADPHARLRSALAEDPAFLAGLLGLAGEGDGDGLLWLWGQGGERKLPLDEVGADALSDLDWGQYQAGIQLGYALEGMAGEGLVQQVATRVEALLGALAPVTTSALH